MLKRLFLGFGLLGLAHLAAAAEVDVDLLARVKWTQLESENFSVITDISPPKAKTVVAELERFRHFMFSRFGTVLVEPSEKMPMVLVERLPVFAALGIPAGYAGVFSHSESSSAILANARGFSRARKGKANWGRTVVLHELVHYFLRHSQLNAASAPWFDEGVAEYFSTYLEHKDDVVLGDAQMVLKRIHSMLSLEPDETGQTLLGPELIASEQLFKAPPELLNVVQRTAQEREQFLDAFYARSLAVVHYFSANHERRQQLLSYLRLLEQGQSVDSAFAKAFALEFVELDQQVAAYLQSGSLSPRKLPLHVQAKQIRRSSVQTQRLRRRQAMEFLIPKISALPDEFLGKGNREKMLTSIEEIYPGFFRS